jgi:hypothetical protein
MGLALGMLFGLKGEDFRVDREFREGSRSLAWKGRRLEGN